MSGRTRSAARGLSLAETVIAVFLLLCACMVVVALFHSSLRYSSRVLVHNAAARVAEKRLAMLRVLARQDFYGPVWATYTGVPAPDPDEPEFRVAIRQNMDTLSSPCSSLENLQGGRARTLSSSFRRVTVTVSWLPTTTANQLSLTSLIGAPARSVNGCSLTVQALDYRSPLPPNDTITFRARLNDGSTNEIPDIMFAWHVVPGVGGSAVVSGNGIIDPNHGSTLRTGRSATFRNSYPHFDVPAWKAVPGAVTVEAVARYRGIQFERRQTPRWLNEE